MVGVRCQLNLCDSADISGIFPTLKGSTLSDKTYMLYIVFFPVASHTKNSYQLISQEAKVGPNRPDTYINQNVRLTIWYEPSNVTNSFLHLCILEVL